MVTGTGYGRGIMFEKHETAITVTLACHWRFSYIFIKNETLFSKESAFRKAGSGNAVGRFERTLVLLHKSDR